MNEFKKVEPSTCKYLYIELEMKDGIAKVLHDSKCYIKTDEHYNDNHILFSEASDLIKGYSIGSYKIISDNIRHLDLRCNIDGVYYADMISAHFSSYQFQKNIIHNANFQIRNIQNIELIQLDDRNSKWNGPIQIHFYLYEKHIEMTPLKSIKSAHIRISKLNNNILDHDDTLYFSHENPDKISKEQFIDLMEKYVIVGCKLEATQKILFGLYMKFNDQNVSVYLNQSAYQFSDSVIEISDFISNSPLEYLEFFNEKESEGLIDATFYLKDKE